LEWYFGDYNYPTDTFLHSLELNEHYVLIDDILKFPKMRKDWHATREDVLESSKFTTVYEVDQEGLKIRKKEKSIN
jgi:hypothetical protein